MEFFRRNLSNYSSQYSLPIIVLFITSLSILMICMAVIETYTLPYLFERGEHTYINDIKLDMFFSTLWIVFISFKLRNQRSGYWFFSWWPILAILSVVAVYIFSALMGLPIGREERFPALLVMLPSIGVLLILSLGSAVYNGMKSLLKSLRIKDKS